MLPENLTEQISSQVIKQLLILFFFNEYICENNHN